MMNCIFVIVLVSVYSNWNIVCDSISQENLIQSEPVNRIAEAQTFIEIMRNQLGSNPMNLSNDGDKYMKYKNFTNNSYSRSGIGETENKDVVLARAVIENPNAVELMQKNPIVKLMKVLYGQNGEIEDVETDTQQTESSEPKNVVLASATAGKNDGVELALGYKHLPSGSQLTASVRHDGGSGEAKVGGKIIIGDSKKTALNAFVDYYKRYVRGKNLQNSGGMGLELTKLW